MFLSPAARKSRSCTWWTWGAPRRSPTQWPSISTSAWWSCAASSTCSMRWQQTNRKMSHFFYAIRSRFQGFMVYNGFIIFLKFLFLIDDIDASANSGGGAGGWADQRPVPGGQAQDGARAADQAGPGRAVGPGGGPTMISTIPLETSNHHHSIHESIDIVNLWY